MTRRELIEAICKAVDETEVVEGIVAHIQKPDGASQIILNTSSEALYGIGKRMQMQAESHMKGEWR